MRKYLLWLFVALLHVRAAYCPETSPQEKERITFMAKKHVFERDVYNQSLSPELFVEALYYSGVICPEIAYKQAQIETGGFRSNLLWRGNNLFGMKMARKRPTTATNMVYGHAAYKHWYDSIKDYALWQQWHKERGYSLDDYFKFLQEIGYATDRNYIKKLKSISDYS